MTSPVTSLPPKSLSYPLRIPPHPKPSYHSCPRGRTSWPQPSPPAATQVHPLDHHTHTHTHTHPPLPLPLKTKTHSRGALIKHVSVSNSKNSLPISLTVLLPAADLPSFLPAPPYSICLQRGYFRIRHVAIAPAAATGSAWDSTLVISSWHYWVVHWPTLSSSLLFLFYISSILFFFF